MVGADVAVGRTKGNTAGRAVGDKKTIKRVTGPVEPQGMAHKGRQRMSSTVNRVSSITVSVNSGLRTESRPTSARNWISRKETGDTPQGRYRSIHGNSASRFEPRTSQMRKCVSRRTVTAQSAAVKRGCVQGRAIPKTIGPLSRHPVRAGVVCTVEHLCHSECWLLSLGAARAGALCAALRSPRRRELHRGDETNSSWPPRPLRFSCVQCTRSGEREQGKLFTLRSWRDKEQALTHFLSQRARVRV